MLHCTSMDGHGIIFSGSSCIDLKGIAFHLGYTSSCNSTTSLLPALRSPCHPALPPGRYPRYRTPSAMLLPPLRSQNLPGFLQRYVPAPCGLKIHLLHCFRAWRICFTRASSKRYLFFPLMPISPYLIRNDLKNIDFSSFLLNLSSG